MKKSNEHLERLTSRKLDGELSPDESLELDKILIRDPSAREEFAALERIDRLAVDLLQEVCGDRGEVVPNDETYVERKTRSRWLGLVPIAAAACAALWFSGLVFRPGSTDQGINDTIPTPAIQVAQAPDNDAGDVILVKQPTAPARERGTSVNYYGVLNEASDAMYLLEVKRRTIAERNRRRSGYSNQGRVILTSGDM